MLSKITTSLGVTKCSLSTLLLPHPAINFLCEGCSGCLHPRAENHHSRLRSFEHCLIPSTFTSIMVAFCGVCGVCGIKLLYAEAKRVFFQMRSHIPPGIALNMTKALSFCPLTDTTTSAAALLKSLRPLIFADFLGPLSVTTWTGSSS